MDVPALLIPDTSVIQGNVLSVLLLAMSGLQRPLLLLRPNSWTNSKQKSEEFFSLLFQSPLQLCLEISIYTDPRNLLRIATVQLLYTVKDEKWKT